MTQRVKVRYRKRPLSFSMSCTEQQNAPLMKFRQLKRLQFLQARTDSPHLKNLEPRKDIKHKSIWGQISVIFYVFSSIK